MPRHNPALHRNEKVPMTPGRRRLLIAGAILLTAALGWGLSVILE